jgi:hypothetical protein
MSENCVLTPIFYFLSSNRATTLLLECRSIPPYSFIYDSSFKFSINVCQHRTIPLAWGVG